jgi:hypothetical protein
MRIGIFGESASEPGKGRMIGRRMIEGKTLILFKGDPVVDLGFQLERFEFSKIWIGSFFLPGFSKNRDSVDRITNAC